MADNVLVVTMKNDESWDFEGDATFALDEGNNLGVYRASDRELRAVFAAGAWASAVYRSTGG